MHKTSFEELVKIAKAWDATNTLQAGLALDKAEEATWKSMMVYYQRKNHDWNKKHEA